MFFVKFKIIFLIVFIFCITELYAVEVSNIVIKGNYSEINFDDITSRRGELESEELRIISAEITDRYLQNGYIGSRVYEIQLDKDGTVIFVIDQPIVNRVEVKGVDKDLQSKISKFIIGNGKFIYNENRILSKNRELEKKYNLTDIRILKISRNSKGLKIVLETEKLSDGNFYAMVSTDFIYGISPLVGYAVAFDKSVLDINVSAGILIDQLKMVNTEIEYQYFLSSKGALFYAVNGRYTLERFESKYIDYKYKFIKPSFGYIIYKNSLNYRFGIETKFVNLIDYKIDKQNYYEPALFFMLSYSDKKSLLNKRKANKLKFKSGIVRESMNDSNYFYGNFDLEVPFYPFSTEIFRLVTKVNCSYTTSDERIHWDYVFGNGIRGIFNDYTASSWKNSGGIDFEFELSRDFLYFGPFIDAGYYLDESNVWEKTYSSGVLMELIYGKISANFIYGFDISKGYSSGGFIVYLNGSF